MKIKWTHPPYCQKPRNGQLENIHDVDLHVYILYANHVMGYNAEHLPDWHSYMVTKDSDLPCLNTLSTKGQRTTALCFTKDRIKLARIDYSSCTCVYSAPPVKSVNLIQPKPGFPNSLHVHIFEHA